MKQFYKVLVGTESSAAPGFHYNIDSITEAPFWIPEGDGPKESGGFSIATEKALIRWIFRGDTLYDVIIPDDADILYPKHHCVQGELARVNKLILTNPRPMTDELAMQFYKASHFTRKEYNKILAGCAICGYVHTCVAILKERIRIQDAQACLDCWERFIKPEHCLLSSDGKLYKVVQEKLQELAQIYQEKTGY